MKTLLLLIALLLSAASHADAFIGSVNYSQSLSGHNNSRQGLYLRVNRLTVGLYEKSYGSNNAFITARYFSEGPFALDLGIKNGYKYDPESRFVRPAILLTGAVSYTYKILKLSYNGRALAFGLEFKL